ncbi:hypothetical protein BDQ17DRAFT_1336157 [Cyathus striatus]|nr:hypothetical protein BDQ17DRAFT_1336157 [Cyathus striatus]
MPRTKLVFDEKVTAAIEVLHDIGYRSPNEFVLAFYHSEGHAAQALRYQENASYIPSSILQAWSQNSPKESRNHLNSAITQAATDIIVAELLKACRDPTLQLSAAGITVPFLTSDFGLDQIKCSYDTLLPCFTILLSSVITATNDYEHKKNTEKIGKDVMAIRIIMGLFLASSGVGWQAIDIFNHMGVSYTWI